MSSKVYIDGHAGTTGLRIRDWLAGRSDLELLTLPDTHRKDPAARRAQVEASDVTVLCLPDDAAREAAQWGDASGTKLLDASTAHRVSEGWVYGLPELAREQRRAIANATKVTNPGCYPTGFVLLVRPLIDAGIVPPSTPLSIHALSGYSGGGRRLIEKWEDAGNDLLTLPYEAPYALDCVHKHVPEMLLYSGLEHAPQFVPAVGPFRTGMRVQVPLHIESLAAGASAKTIWEALADRYAAEPFVRIVPIAEPLDAHEHSFDPRACNDTNRIALQVIPHPSGHVLLLAILDNLGKGAAGGAIQNLNLMLGCDEGTGLPV
jgi:N-acetyl-gamma-glutamyl-phosphate reductase